MDVYQFEMLNDDCFDISLQYVRVFIYFGDEEREKEMNGN